MNTLQMLGGLALAPRVIVEGCTLEASRYISFEEIAR